MEIPCGVINDLCSLHLGMMGIIASIMTLLYASLCSKVEELKVLRTSEDYTMMNRATAVENCVKALRKLNGRVIKALSGSFALFVISTGVKYFPIYWFVILDIAATLLLLAFCIYLAYKIYSQYQNETL